MTDLPDRAPGSGPANPGPQSRTLRIGKESASRPAPLGAWPTRSVPWCFPGGDWRSPYRMRARSSARIVAISCAISGFGPQTPGVDSTNSSKGG